MNEPSISSGSQEADGSKSGGLGIFRLVTTVITLIIGGGVFTLAGDQAANGASGYAIMTAWGISAVGVLCLVLSFYALSRIKPKLTGGIYSYANAGFGDFLGFNSAWGYWISALLCTVSFSALLFGALTYFFPIFGGGNNLPSVIGASCLIWFYVFLVSRGIKEVTGVNAVITISKIVPIFVAILAIIVLQKFDPAIFMANLTNGAVSGMPFWEQVSGTMMITIWVFVGIEGAVAISGRAKKEKDVGKATVIAFFCVLTIYLLVSMLSMGVLPLSELATLENPALAGVLEAAVGPWGATLINAGVVLSLVGAMLGYTVLSSESPFEAAEQGVFIKAFAKTNKKGAPIVTLVVTN
ncbi:MAG: amino acid permease, partial [Raoultibacter sp.]